MNVTVPGMESVGLRLGQVHHDHAKMAAAAASTHCSWSTGSPDSVGRLPGFLSRRKLQIAPALFLGAAANPFARRSIGARFVC